MTNSSPEPSNRPNFSDRVSQFMHSPAFWVGGGIAIGLGIGGFVGLRYWVFRQLPSYLAAQLGQFLHRPVEVGSVESFSLGGIRLGASSIAATKTDRDRLSVKAIAIGLNPFPLLIGQPLALKVELDSPQGYIDQDKSGRWLNIELPQGQAQALPFQFNLQVGVKNANLALNPQFTPKIIKITANGQGEYRYRGSNRQWVSYDLAGTVLDSAIALRGNTTLESGASQVELQVKQLSVDSIAGFFANSSIIPKKGAVNANLIADFPSFAQVEQTQGQGDLSLQGIEAQILPLKLPLKLNLDLNFRGQTVLVQQLQASMGKISAQAKGLIHWQKGYDLQLTLNPVVLSELPKTFLFDYPFPIQGTATAKMRILGKLNDPTVTGTIQNSQPLQIDRTSVKRFQSTFQADLNQISLYSVLIQPTVGGEISGQGRLITNLQRSAAANKQTDWLKMPLIFDFKGNLPAQPLLSPYFRQVNTINNGANKAKLGVISAQGRITGTFSLVSGEARWQSANLATSNQGTLAGSGIVQLQGSSLLSLKDTVLTTAGGEFRLAGKGDFGAQQWQTQLSAHSFPLSPLISVVCSLNSCPAKLSPTALSQTTLSQTPLTLTTADVRLQGPLKNFSLERLTGIANLNLQVNDGAAALQSTFNQGNIQAQAQAAGFNLNPFLSNVSVPVRLKRSQISVASPISGLLAGKSWNAQGLKADLSADLAVANRSLAATGQLRAGQLKAIAHIDDLPLRTLVSSWPVAAHLQNAQLQVTGNINALLASWGTAQPDWSGLQAQASGALNLPGGQITAQANLARNRWQVEALTQKLQLNALLRSLRASPSTIALAPLDAQLRLSGDVSDLFRGGATVPVVVERLAIASGRQDLNAQGSLLLSLPLQALDFAQADLQANFQINAQGELGDLPLTQLLAIAPTRPDFLPEQLKLTGKGRFQGQLLAQHLISAPTAPGNIQLKGNLNLNNLVFNQRAFEPRLAGTLDATLGKAIALNLRGAEDLVAASLIACNRPPCSLPYIPASLELRQTYGQTRPLIAQAQLQGDRLVGRIEQFPLALLRLSPGKSYGIRGNLQGEVNAAFAIDPYSLQGDGTLAIQNIALGAIAAQGFSAQIAYRDAIARLNDATLQIGESLYHLDGSLNLRNGVIQANFGINQGKIQDILNAFKISDINSLIALLQFRPQNYATAAAVVPKPVGANNATLAELVNLLAQIDEKIIARAKQLNQGGIPTTLDIRGGFAAQVSLGGTLQQPTAQFQLTGDRWEWYPQRSFPNIVPPLGLVMTNSQAIALNQLTIKGSLENGRLTIDPARFQLKDSEFSLAGQLSLSDQKIQATYHFDRLDFDTIATVVKLPLDISGQINLLGQVTGSLKNPQVAGTFGLVDGALNARSLKLDLLGQYTYLNQRFTLATSQTSPIVAYVSIPWPISSPNNEADIRLRLNTASLQLLSILTQDQLAWLGGEGSLVFDGKVRLDPEQPLNFKAIANGKLTLKDAVIKSAALPQALLVNGEATLTQNGLEVSQLTGQFAQSQWLISGFLPLFAVNAPVANPLTIRINRGRVNLENLYAGEIDGQIIVRGNVFNPLISGGVQLANGEVFVPQSRLEENKVASALSHWSKPLQQNSPVRLQLDQFQVALHNLAIEQLPLYRFEFGGDLLLSGDLGNIQNLEPKGEIAIGLGRISFFDTRFLIDRRQPNLITFTPNRGLLNPDVAVTMRTIVSDLPNSQRLRSDTSNEIPLDSIIKIQRVDIGLTVKGPLSQLMPDLSANSDEICRRKNVSALVQTDATFSPQELSRLSRCLEVLVAKNASNEQIFNNPAIRLTSSPPRSQGEIIRLLGEQLIVLADALQGKNTDQLIQVGIVQLALPMVFQGVVYDVENAISNTVGTTDFRLVPFLEAVYRVEKDGFVRMGYDYSSNEVRVRYEKRF